MSEAEEFLGLTTSNIPTRPSDVRTRRKLAMVFLAWIAGLLIAYPDPRAVGYIPLFPFGLWGFLTALIKIQGAENTILVLGWLIYIALTITTLVMGRRKWFYIWWTILTILLLLNGAGCHAMLKSLDGIN
jgi:hypothetical protein